VRLSPFHPAGALVVLGLLACGCATSGGAGSTAQHTPSPDAQRRVARMVLGNGELPGYIVQTGGPERLNAQLVPHAMPRAALADRLIRASWLASEHSLLVTPGGARPAVFSDANLFRSTAVAGRVWSLEQAPVPGIAVHSLPVPAGAPPGASYGELRKGTRSEFEIAWRQGPVIALDVIAVASSPAPPPSVVAGIGAILGRAAQVQQGRIARALEFDRSV
jgi:hypothetical protein